jgi:integrase
VRYSPHSLRHRRATRWHHEGVPTKALAERVGHPDVALTLNLYSHVLDPGRGAAGVAGGSADATSVYPRRGRYDPKRPD